MNMSVLKVFGWLVWRDLRVLKKDFLNNLVNAMVMPATFIIIGGYILPYLGMPADYGAFMIVGSYVRMCYFTTNWRDGMSLVSDLQGDRSVSYELTLPIHSWLIFVKYSVAFGLDAFFLNILTLPLGKLILGDKFSLGHLHIPKFILIYLLMNLFLGAFTLYLISWTKGNKGFSRFHLRFGSQLLFFGGFQFPWVALHEASPFWSYVNLLNPLVYAYEGNRAAVLGQANTLPYWVCVGMLSVSIVIFAVLAIRGFKNRLDYV